MIYQLVPGKGIDNGQSQEFAASLASLYRPLLSRVDARARKVAPQETVWWEVVMTPKAIRFYVVAGEASAGYLKKRLETCWPGLTVKEVDADWLPAPDAEAWALSLKRHSFLALKVDRRALLPLPSILEASRLLQDGELAAVEIGLRPLPASWREGIISAYEAFQKGDMPARVTLSGRDVRNAVARAGVSVGYALMGAAAEILSGKEAEFEPVPNPDRQVLLQAGSLSHATVTKSRYEGFDATVRIVVGCPQEHRRALIRSALFSALRDLDDDNCLSDPRAVREPLIASRGLAWKVNGDHLGAHEVGQLLQLPTTPLQLEYPSIDSLAFRERAVPDEVTRGGLLFGQVTNRGMTSKVHFPTSNMDDLCSGLVILGQKGSGKSTAASNLAVEAIRAGYSVFAHDAADSKMLCDILDGLPETFPDDHIMFLDFGCEDYVVPLDWMDSAARRSSMVADRMSSELADFLGRFSEDMGGQTRRWLKRACQAAYSSPGATLLDPLVMFENACVRKAIEQTVKDALVRDAWEAFDKLSEARQRQIAEPVFSRIDYLLDETRLKNILCQPPLLRAGKPVIDFRRWADGDERGPYCVLCYVPKGELHAHAVDAVMTFLNVKEWLAVLSRGDIPVDKRRPVFALWDEPHQYPSIAAKAEEQWVEARKWRLALTWCFHSWSYLSRDLVDVMKAGGPQYLLYQTSKDTWETLAEEIAPYTVEDALRIPQYHAIVRMSVRGPVEPFVARMSPPAPKVKDRAHVRQACRVKYGRPIGEVKRLIYEKERLLLG